ncbi:MAG: GNAT family N-acetyltransferase [Kiritimatiellae bacterium]|nr:GNAT family N-acetyltransferase [Kiritimatiellia bacterium]
MPDMLVKLYNLPAMEPHALKMKEEGVVIRMAAAYDKYFVLEWVTGHFSKAWASECDRAFSNQPVSCFIAIKDGRMMGFACYDCTRLDVFGPTGVDESLRGRGVGKALCMAAMHAMAAKGYAYAIIGWVGPADFYSKLVGATLIEDSTPGMYKDMLKA